jgi:hypothetical protein
MIDLCEDIVDEWICASMNCAGAGDETRTRDIQLGRLALYQLSYSRVPCMVHASGLTETM